MARIRTIKPEFPQSESVGNLSRDARLCFIMLWTIADDAGRLRGASRMLASLLFPYDTDAPKLMDRWLAELSEQGCITRYEADGAQYIEITNWLEHQKIDRPSQSKFPAFDAASRTIAKPREASSLDQGPKDQGPKDQGRAQAREVFDRFWKAYPKKEAKGEAEKAFAKACKQADPEKIIAALARFRWPEDRQFIPHPASWLNARRWEDEQQATGEHLMGDPHLEQWRARLKTWKPGGYWPDVWGNKPGEPGCVVPGDLLREMGLVA